jgi:hypothetical protein
MNVDSLGYRDITRIIWRLAILTDLIQQADKQIQKSITRGVELERERCAKLVSGNYGWVEGKGDYYGNLADLIRGVSDGKSEG